MPSVFMRCWGNQNTDLLQLNTFTDPTIRHKWMQINIFMKNVQHNQIQLSLLYYSNVEQHEKNSQTNYPMSLVEFACIICRKVLIHTLIN